MEKIGVPIDSECPADYRPLSLNCNNREQLVNFSQISGSFVSIPGDHVRSYSPRWYSLGHILPNWIRIAQRGQAPWHIAGKQTFVNIGHLICDTNLWTHFDSTAGFVTCCCVHVWLRATMGKTLSILQPLFLNGSTFIASGTAFDDRHS